MSSVHLRLAIASSDPERLANFYAFATNGKLDLGENQHHWKVVLKYGMTIHLYRPDKNDLMPRKGRAMSICLELEPSPDPFGAIQEWARVLIAGGAMLAEEAKLASFGAEAWMTDPEDNDFLIFVPFL